MDFIISHGFPKGFPMIFLWFSPFSQGEIAVHTALLMRVGIEAPCGLHSVGRGVHGGHLEPRRVEVDQAAIHI